MQAPLYLLDGTLLFFRALYGMPDVFSDGAGRRVNGVRGYLTYLMNLVHGRAGLPEPVRFCAAAFDESLNTCWRNDKYPAYKANRTPADDNIRYQLARAREFTALLGVPVLADLRYEADDFIATLAKQSSRPVVVVSRDKDLQQLLNDNLTLLDPKDGSQTDAGGFEQRFGFQPSLFPDYQALTGDSVDNIPGVRGAGPKSAGRLIGAFGTLEALYAAEARWPEAGVKATSKLSERLLDEKAQAFLFREILRLDDQVPVGLDLDATRLAPPDGQAVQSALAQWELSTGLGTNLLGAMKAYCQGDAP